MIPEGKYIDVQDDFRFHYYDEGDGDVVVLLHGSGTGASGHTNFKNNFIALRNAGYRVILPDLPGYGFSSKPDNIIYSLDYFNQKIIELLDSLSIQKFSLIGYFWILLILWLGHPIQIHDLQLNEKNHPVNDLTFLKISPTFHGRHYPLMNLLKIVRLSIPPSEQSKFFHPY